MEFQNDASTHFPELYHMCHVDRHWPETHEALVIHYRNNVLILCLPIQFIWVQTETSGMNRY